MRERTHAQALGTHAQEGRSSWIMDITQLGEVVERETALA